MFDAKKPEDSGLETAIENVYSEMAGETSDTEQYSKMVDQLIKLYSLKRKPDRVSADTLAIIIGNMIIAALITNHEKTHIVTSKVFNFLLKTRLTT